MMDIMVKYSVEENKNFRGKVSKVKQKELSKDNHRARRVC